MARRSHEHVGAREWLVVYGPLLVLVFIGFWVASRYIQPAPPERIVIAAGEPEGAYAAFAERYRERLKQEGIELEIRYTHGSLDNLRLLKQHQVDLAFLQGGVAEAHDYQRADITALGSLYYEPLWLFHRASLRLDRIPLLQGAKVAIGAEGSGTHALVSRLIRENHLQTNQLQLLPWTGKQAAEGLLSGNLDAAFFVSSPQSQIIRKLLHRPEKVRLASFERAGAYARRYDFLTTLILPEGAEDLGRNIPDRDIRLLATTTSLIAQADLHPAVVSLMMQILSDTHGQGSWFAEKGTFPSPKYVGFRLNPQAEHYYQHGAPFLQRYLPFWAASLIDRMKIMMLPLLGLILPLFKILPPLYRWRMRARIYRWYSELESVDKVRVNHPEEAQALLERLDELEREVREIRVPLAFFQQLYHLRLHIDFIRSRLQGEASSAKPKNSDFQA